MKRRSSSSRLRRRRALRVEPLEARIVLTASAVCAAAGSVLHTIPFEISGGGPAPDGIPFFPGGTAQHFATGEATRMGGYDGSGTFRLEQFTSPLTGEFSSLGSFVFGGSNGDNLAFFYGNVSEGASSPGEFTIFPQDDGNVIVEFVAEFTLDTSESTGRFDKYSEGSFVMIATTEPFSPVPDANGFSVPFNYTWEGHGHLSFPVGSTYEVTNKADSGDGSLRDAIEQANLNEGIDTINFAPGLKGKIPLESQLQVTDSVTICGPGHRLAVSGQGETRVLSVDPVPAGVFGVESGERVAVEIHDLIIADGLALDAPGILGSTDFAFGGGIYNRGSDVSLESVRFVGNQAGDGNVPLGAGGAIANEFGGTVTVQDGVFIRNSAEGRSLGAGGAVTADVGPTLDGLGTKSPVTLVNDTWFARNEASAEETDPLAAGSFAPFAGLAFGGAVNALAGEFVAQDSEFVRNSVHSGDGVNGNDSGNANGGAILVSDFSPFIVAPGAVPGRDSINRVERSHFTRNSANAGEGDGSGEGGYANGGAIAANVAFPFFPDTLQVSESTFIRNQARGGEGGDENGDGGQAVGGAIAGLTGASITIDASTFLRNEARGGEGDGSGAGGTALGGAVGLAPFKSSVPTPFEQPPFIPNLVLSDSLLSRNLAKGGRGGHSGDGGDGYGGAAGFLGAGTGALSNVAMFRNTAMGGRGGRNASGGDAGGGGIYNDAAIVSLTSSFTGFNRAKGGRATGRGGIRGEGLGGGIYNSDAGTFSIDAGSLDAVIFNRADDPDFNNIFGDLDLI